MRDKIYGLGRDEVLGRIKKLADSYTPEWKFDTKNPDAGSAIGMIFAEQTIDNLEMLHLLFENYHREFVNLFGISLKPASPGFGAAFISGEGASSIPVLKGTSLVGEDVFGDEIVFETLHDLFAVNAELCSVIFCSPRKDKKIPFRGSFLTMDFGKEKPIPALGEEEGLGEEIPFFCDRGKSIGTQALMLYHSHLFEIQEQDFSIRFYGEEDSKDLAELFTDNNRFRFFYVDDSQAVPFKQVHVKGDAVVLVPFSHGNIQKMFLVLESFLMEDIRISDIELAACDPVMEPDFVWDGTRELSTREFHPFGEELAPYRECYVGQQSLMDYSGGKLWMEFELSFEEFTARQPEAAADLRLIKRRPRQKITPVEYDCYMDEVSFEYFNGTGFRKLECDMEVGKIFSGEGCQGKYQIFFDMPKDWEGITAGGYEQRCILLKGVRADNCYLPNVKYHYPVIRNLRFGIQDREENLRPEKVTAFRGISDRDITEDIKKKQPVTAFFGQEKSPDRMYLGFCGKFQGGPVGLYFQVEEKQNWEDASLVWLYSSKKGFKPLKVTDHTKNLRKSGVLLFMPPGDMEELEIEGSRCYWIGVEDAKGFYSRKHTSPPVVKRIFVNAVEIQNMETLEEQEYFADFSPLKRRFPLYANHILHAKVWVNEKGALSQEEMKGLLKSCPENVRAEYNVLGEIEEFYVLWQEAEEFELSENPRSYRIDRGTSELIFGEGIQGAAAKNRDSAAFKVQVTRCSGERGNLAPFSSLRFRGHLGLMKHMETTGKITGGWDMEGPGDALKRGSHVISGRKRLVSLADYEREAMFFSRSIHKVSCVPGKNGKITMVLLMKDYKEGSHGFYAVRNGLKNHLMAQCEITCKEEGIEIVEPVFVEISVKLWVTAKDMGESIEVSQKWLKGIECYLEPVGEGEHKGWEIGKLPGKSQLKMWLSSVESGRICHISASARYQMGGLDYEVDLEELECLPSMVCVNGKHEVFVSAERKEGSHDCLKKYERQIL